MDDPSVVNALRESALFATCSESVLAEIAACSLLRRLSPGVRLFREGETNRRAYVVHAGLISLEMNVPPHGAVRVLTLGPGELVAWSALLGGNVMNASATASGEVELVEMDAAALLARCDANHDLGYQVMREVAKAVAMRLMATRLQLLDVYSAERPEVPETSHVG